ncbi:hypothetical protein BD560DRAFT_119456 [Blakeslea trispora]|nr:hypothetical protein BD560DRAFT_119456 [Blakeslea trispora]
MLNRVQFQTVRLDELVDDVYYYFDQNYVMDEIVHCRMNGYTYVARIVDLLPGRVVVQLENRTDQSTPPNSETQNTPRDESEDNATIPRQPNGRLRFPDAFLHPTPQSPHVQQESSEPAENHMVEERQYKVQLLNEVGQPLEDCRRIVLEHQLDRDRHVFNRMNVQSFIRECAYKEAYFNAPWLIKPSLAVTYGIDTTLPHHLQHLHDQFCPQSSRKRKMTPFKTAVEREAEKRARRQESLLQKAKLKEEKDRLREERRKQAAIKYPIEDLDLPIYRKDPNLNWALVDMHPQKYDAKEGSIIPYPSGGRSERPKPHHDFPIPPDLFDIFLSIWAFLTVFSEPLKLTAYSIDDFERALFHDTHQPKATVLVEYNACLLNVIISERKEDTANELINGELMEAYVESLEEDMEENENEEDEEEATENETEKQRNTRKRSLREGSTQSSVGQQKKPSVLPRVERGWRDKEHLKFAQKWDHKELRANYDRRGWETTLIGCLNDVATPEILPNVDELLQHLVPKMSSSAADREKQYPTLSVKQKLDILSFLIDVVNESTLIKNYMDYCQDQLSEFRKQKVELNKESKILAIKRSEMDKRDKAEKFEELSEEEQSEGDDSSSSEHSEDEEEGDLESDSSDTRLANREKRHQSRQEKLRQKQLEREEQEKQRKRQYAEQREVAKAKNHEQRIKANERRKLEEEERNLKKKEENIERSMRRYMTLRIRPLGKDRFNNRYFYLDNVGVSNTHGSGRLYVHSPSDGDILLMMERDSQTNPPEQPWGYGGGRWFIKKLMHEQGLVEESDWLEQRMDELNTDPSKEYHGWWKYYSKPEEIEQLLGWLNPKGIRENKLKNELIKQQPYIIESITKRTQALNKPESVSKRPNRSAASKSM